MIIYINYDKRSLLNIDPNMSIPDFQLLLQEKFGIPVSQQIIHYKGKPINRGFIKDYDPTPESNIFLSKQMIGGKSAGNTAFKTFFWITMIFLFIALFLTLILGLLPVWAHIFVYLVEQGLQTIFGKRTGIGATVLKWIFIILKAGAVVLFIYVLTTLAYFMMFFNRGQKFCQSVVLSKYIGMTLSAIFIIIYGMFVLPDMAAQGGLKIQNTVPVAIGALMTPILNLLTWIADTAKFSLFYAIPMVGEFLMLEQEVVGYIAEYVYVFLRLAKEFTCEAEGFEITLYGLLEFTRTPYGCTFVQDHNLERIVEYIFYMFEDDIKGIVLQQQKVVSGIKSGITSVANKFKNKMKDSQIQEKLDQLSKNKDVKALTSKAKKMVKDKLKREDACDIFPTMLKFAKIKWANYDEDTGTWKNEDARLKWEKNPYKIDRISSALMPFAKNLFCSFLRLFPASYDVLNNGIGPPYVLSNMIENSQVAGISTFIAGIVILILSAFMHKMYGIEVP
jgi:hypothetical protein